MFLRAFRCLEQSEIAGNLRELGGQGRVFSPL